MWPVESVKITHIMVTTKVNRPHLHGTPPFELAFFPGHVFAHSSFFLFQKKNSNLCEMIHQERQMCLDVKVQIRVIQQKQKEEAGEMEKDLLIFDE